MLRVPSARWPDLSGKIFLARSAFLELTTIPILLSCAWGLIAADLVPVGVPSPFWIPVLIASLHHGLMAGLLAAAAAALVNFFAFPPEYVAGFDYYDAWLVRWTEPALWLMSALFVGSIRERQMLERSSCQNERLRLEDKARTLQTYAEALCRRTEQLERQVATSAQRSTYSITEAVLDFRNQDGPLPRRLASLFHRLLGDGRYELELFNASGANLAGEALKTAARRMRGQSRQVIFSLLDPGGELACSRGALFVCPIIAPSGALLGQLTIFSIGRDWSDDIDSCVRLLASELTLTLLTELGLTRRSKRFRAHIREDRLPPVRDGRRRLESPQWPAR